jgi:hypothetical protein
VCGARVRVAGGTTMEIAVYDLQKGR